MFHRTIEIRTYDDVYHYHLSVLLIFLFQYIIIYLYHFHNNVIQYSDKKT